VAEILDLVITRHRDRGIGTSLEFTRDESWLRDICRGAGLTETDNTGREWEYDLDAVDMVVSVPDAYTVTTLAERPDIDRGAVARCIARAFESSRDLEPIVRNIEKNPMFRPELSSLVIADDGTVAAYCRGTVDPDNGVCGIDPVCTDPDHHRRGLGKAVVRQLMANQHDLGGRLVYIGSAPPPAPGTFLYQALGPSREFVGCEWSG
jgi:ribosomal protein S18 acetylase RimI-like enzyme